MNPPTVRLELIPEPLKQRSQWVCWRYARPSNGSTHRWCKVPISPVNGRPAKTTIPSTWSDFGRAVTFFGENRSRLAGVGFVFSDDDPFVGIDMDHCRDITTGGMNSWSQSLVNELDSYTEVSPSGTGVKCILQSLERVPSKRRSSLGIEVYSSDRFFTITGQLVGSRCTINDRTNQILKLHAELFPAPDTPALSSSALSAIRRSAPDDHVLNRAATAKNGEKFKQLWQGDLSLHCNNHSEADLSLCRILAFWCGPYPEQIDRLFRKSALFRPKWDQPHFADGTTYGQQTINRAIIAQGETFFPWPINKWREMAAAIT